jgi:hypothetical protein
VTTSQSLAPLTVDAVVLNCFDYGDVTFTYGDVTFTANGTLYTVSALAPGADIDRYGRMDLVGEGRTSAR